jgi:hypothetical protein
VAGWWPGAWIGNIDSAPVGHHHPRSHTQPAGGGPVCPKATSTASLGIIGPMGLVISSIEKFALM